MWKEFLEQSSSPSSLPEVKSWEEQRREYYEKHRKRINSNNELINLFNTNRDEVFAKCEYKHNRTAEKNRWYHTYEQGIKEMIKYIAWPSKNERNHFLRLQKGEASAFSELNEKIKQSNSKSDRKFSLPDWKMFDIQPEDETFWFAPKIKFIMLTHTSESPPKRTFLFQFYNINFPKQPEKKKPGAKKKQTSVRVKTETTPKQKTEIPQNNSTIDPSKKQSIDLKHKNISIHPELSYIEIQIHKDTVWTELSRSKKFYIINNNWEIKEVNESIYINYKLAVLEWKRQDRDISIFRFFTNLYPVHSNIFSN